jgi:hypothetical protein
MIHWLHPGALAGLALLALPVLMHLLRTHQAERIPFPSLRFLRPSRTAAVRFRLPADWLLLLTRLGIVAAAIAAVAGPVLVTASRLRSWNNAIGRAVIVDTGPSVTIADASANRPIAAAREAAAAEARSATYAATIETANLRDGLVRAASYLSHTPPSRREIVVISTFVEGNIGESDVTVVPADAGLRFVRVGAEVNARVLPTVPLLAAPGSAAQVVETQLSGPETRVRLSRATVSQSGLTIAGADSRALQGLLRSVAAAGAPSADASEPLECAFGSEETSGPAIALGPGSPRWMLRALVRLQTSEALRQASSDATQSTVATSDSWTTVSFDAGGRPMVELATRNGRLVMRVGAPADSYVAAAALRALLNARTGTWARPDQEILRTPSTTLSDWSHPAQPVGADAWHRSPESDGRWLWLLALALLGVEQRLRKAHAERLLEIRDAA